MKNPNRKLTNFFNHMLPQECLMLHWFLLKPFQPERTYNKNPYRVRKTDSFLAELFEAKTYEAHCDLSVQLAAGFLERDYSVLVHGWALNRKITAQLYWRRQRVTTWSWNGSISEVGCIDTTLTPIVLVHWKMTFQLLSVFRQRSWRKPVFYLNPKHSRKSRKALAY